LIPTLRKFCHCSIYIAVIALSIYRSCRILVSFTIIFEAIKYTIYFFKTNICLSVCSIIIWIFIGIICNIPFVYIKGSICFCSIEIRYLIFFIPTAKIFIGIHSSIRFKSIIEIADLFDTVSQKCSILHIIIFSINFCPSVIRQSSFYCDSILIAKIVFAIFSCNDCICIKSSPFTKIILFSFYYLKTTTCSSFFSIVILIPFIINIPFICIKTSICFCPIVILFLRFLIPNAELTIRIQDCIVIKSIIEISNFLYTTFQQFPIFYVITFSINFCPIVIRQCLFSCNSFLIAKIVFAISS